jgi:endoglucanase
VRVCILLALWAGISFAQPLNWRGVIRGANAQATISDQDVADFAKTGGNVLRISHGTRPMMQLTFPYSINEDVLSRLDQIIDAAEQNNVRIVIDPHYVPGMTDPSTTFADDPLWNDVQYQDLLVRLWESIALRYQNRGPVIAGYDLLNEPALPGCGLPGTLGDWNALSARLVEAIRKQDTHHTIIVEPPRAVRCGGSTTSGPQLLNTYMTPLADDNIVYSPHFYTPEEIALQGQSGWPEPVAYPTILSGINWNRGQMAWAVEPVTAFQRKYGVPIYIGEFGITRWAGDGANRWLKDAIDLFEENGFSWNYNAWRAPGAPFPWDAERSNTDRSDLQVYTSTPRLELLRGYWGRNVDLVRPRVDGMQPLNSASWLLGPAIPGEFMSLFALLNRPPGIVWGRMNEYGRLAWELDGTKVFFDGVPAPIVGVAEGQVNVLVPYFVANRKSVHVYVDRNGVASSDVVFEVKDSKPALWTWDRTGRGQAAALNRDGKPNSTLNPARLGEVVTVFGTGDGQTDPDGIDGQVARKPLPAIRGPVTARVGGVDAEVLYAGATSGQLAGFFQVNLRIPASAGTDPSTPIVINIRGQDTQPSIYIAVAP